jgi:death-on-curing protein
MLIFLVLNKIDLDYMQDELSGIFLKIAAGEITQDDLLEWIITHQK